MNIKQTRYISLTKVYDNIYGLGVYLGLKKSQKYPLLIISIAPYCLFVGAHTIEKKPEAK